MDGIELYILYVEAMLEQGVGVNEWSELDEQARSAWNVMASAVVLKPLTSE